MTSDSASAGDIADLLRVEEIVGGEDALRSGRRGRTFKSCRPDFEGGSAPSIDLRVESLAIGEGFVLADLPNEQYHSLRCPSKSRGWDFRRHGPVWYRDRHVDRTQPPFFSGALQLGTAVHLAFEWTPEVFRARRVEIPEQYTTASGGLSTGKEAKAWRADQPADALIVSPADNAVIEKIIEQAFANKAIVDLYERIEHRELSAFYRRPDGHAVRCRWDAITLDGIAVDWKTTRDVRPLETWWKACLEHGYHYQDAWYRTIGEGLGLTDGPIRFVTLSTTAPYQCQVVTLPEQLTAQCDAQITADLDEIEMRTEMGNWLPAGYGEVHELQFPAWATRDS